MQIATASATGSDSALLDLVWTGTPNAGGNMIRLDVSGTTATNVPTLIEIVGAGKTVRGLSIDTDGTTVGAALFHSGGALANGVGVINITNDGNLATGGNLLNLTMGGVPHAAAIALEVVAALDCQALVVTTSAATASAVAITGSGATANNTAVLEVNWGTSTPANAGANLLRLDATSITATNTPMLMEILGTGKDVAALYIDADPTALSAVLINSSGAIADDKAILEITGDGEPAASGSNLLRVAFTGTATNAPILVEINGAGKDVTALWIDADSATGNTVEVNNDGNLAAGKSCLFIDYDGTANATGTLLTLNSTTATATNTPYVMKIDSSTKDIAAIDIDSDAATDHVVTINCGGALADNKAMINLTWDGTPAAAGTNMLRVDGSGGTNTVKPVLVEIYDDSVAVGLSVSTASIEDMITFIGTGATGNNSAVVDITSTATLNVGGNLLRVDGSGATTTSKPVLVEILDDSVAVGLSVSTATIEDMVTFIGTGATGSAKAVVDITSTALMNAAGNLLRLDLTGADTTSVPTALEIVGTGETARGIYVDVDGTTVGAAAFHGGGALADGVGVVNITADGALATGGNLLNVTYTGTPSGVTVAAVEVVCAKNCMALDIASSAVGTNCARIVGSGALTDGLAVLSLSSAAALAAGGNVLNVTYTGTPATSAVSAFDLVVSQDCRAMDIVTSAAAVSAVRITGVGSIANDMAMLEIAHATGTAANGASLIKLTGATAATATAYGLTVDCSGANFEAIWVEAGKVKFGETLEVTGAVTMTAAATVGTTLGVTGISTFTAATVHNGGIGSTNWTVDAATATSDGASTGIIPDNVNCVQLTSTNTDYWATLPTPTPGKEVWIIADATSACELRSSAPTTVYINNVVGAGCELTIAADTTYHAICINATNWIIEKWSNAGAPATGGTPD